MHFNIHIKTLTNLKKMNKLLMFDLFYIKLFFNSLMISEKKKSNKLKFF